MNYPELKAMCLAWQWFAQAFNPAPAGRSRWVSVDGGLFVVNLAGIYNPPETHPEGSVRVFLERFNWKRRLTQWAGVSD